MRYVISDIHGCFDLFVALLKKIGFGKDDELYICGDVIEKGLESVRLLSFIASLENVYMIRGNHEESFLNYYAALMRDGEDYDLVLERLGRYIHGDGRLLTWELVDYLEALPYYIETEDFICVHAGVPVSDDGEIPPLDSIPVSELVYNRRFASPDVLPVGAKPIFFGHTPRPTREIGVYAKVEHPHTVHDIVKVHLDLCTFSTGVLGCFSVDDCSVHYVTRWELDGGNGALGQD
jgi:serine/threonine protein phosphatase 1